MDQCLPNAAIELASYGLMVDTEGLLQSVANESSPARQVNAVIKPGGYMDQWCRDNQCEKSVVTLYSSAFTTEAPAYWTPVPSEVLQAIEAAEPIGESPGGPVSYSQYALLLDA